MTGYNPRCSNCHRCSSCRGDGTVIKVSYNKDWKGNQVRDERRETCGSCRGVGGRVGAGQHDHS